MSQRAGWYDDPENPDNLRYFDGVVWTTHTSPKTSPSAAQSTIGLAQQPTQSKLTPSDLTQPVPQAPTQQLPYGGPHQDSSYGRPPQQYGQPPQQYGAQYGPQYGPPAGDYLAMPPAYATGLGVKATPDGVPLASYGQRVGAWLIDAVIQVAITTLAAWYWLAQFLSWYTTWFSQLMNEAESGVQPTIDQTQLSDQIMGYVVPISLVSFLVTIVYQVAFLTWRGATPGKMALGISVRLRERPGTPTLGVALKRQTVYIGTSLLSLVPVIGLTSSIIKILNLLWPLWDDKRQALHDKVAATNVVVSRRGR
jgi:uncharacterized RDD family membrane protein YckC